MLEDTGREPLDIENKLNYILAILAEGAKELEQKALFLGLTEFIEKKGIDAWYDEIKNKQVQH